MLLVIMHTISIILDFTGKSKWDFSCEGRKQDVIIMVCLKKRMLERGTRADERKYKIY